VTRCLWLVLAAGLMPAACGQTPEAAKPPLYSSGTTTSPEEITFLLPGALTTARIFGPANDWASDRHLVVEYRLPGMRGEPMDPPLNLARSAQWVADYANRYPKARINLLGYSTGAAIAIEATGRIEDSRRVKVVAVSSATPFPGAAVAMARGVAGVARSALAAGTLDRQRVWEEYFITLYLGSGWQSSPEKSALADEIRRSFEGRLNTPGEGHGRAQSASLLVWALSPQAKASQADITFFHGENDPVFPLAMVRNLAARLDGTVCVLPQDGHMPYLSWPDLISRTERVFEGLGPCG